jgi:hypothetical protein
MMLPATGELPMTTRTGRWIWCHDHEDGWKGYLHMDCDCACDVDGYCIGCGNASPAVIPETCQLCGENPCKCFDGATLRRETT